MDSTYVETRMINKAFLNKEAIRSFYYAGYITLDEAKQLSEHSWTKRNECTFLILSESGNEIWLDCYETSEELQILFYISYNKFTGTVADATPKLI